MTKVLAFSDGEQAWQGYLEIQRVLEKRYPSKVTHSAISMGLQRLGEAVVYKYKLSPQDHKVTHSWNLTLQHDHNIDLSTTNKMLNARITQWSQGRASVQVGHDTWTEGSESGYKVQKSLQENLELPYSEIKRIVDMTAKKAKKIFRRIQGIVEKEITRLNNTGSSQEKISEISNAIQILAAAIEHKYHTSIPDSAVLLESEKAYVDSMDLYSYNTMLDLKIRKWSLRQTLNLSTESPVSWIFGLREALWGKTTALTNVEKAL